jgi:hypothetical protein
MKRVVSALRGNRQEKATPAEGAAAAAAAAAAAESACSAEHAAMVADFRAKLASWATGKQWRTLMALVAGAQRYYERDGICGCGQDVQVVSFIASLKDALMCAPATGTSVVKFATAEALCRSVLNASAHVARLEQDVSTGLARDLTTIDTKNPCVLLADRPAGGDRHAHDVAIGAVTIAIRDGCDPSRVAAVCEEYRRSLVGCQCGIAQALAHYLRTVGGLLRPIPNSLTTKCQTVAYSLEASAPSSAAFGEPGAEDVFDGLGELAARAAGLARPFALPEVRGAERSPHHAPTYDADGFLESDIDMSNENVSGQMRLRIVCRTLGEKQSYGVSLEMQWDASDARRQEHFTAMFHRMDPDEGVDVLQTSSCRTVLSQKSPLPLDLEELIGWLHRAPQTIHRRYADYTVSAQPAVAPLGREELCPTGYQSLDPGSESSRETDDEENTEVAQCNAYV